MTVDQLKFILKKTGVNGRTAKTDTLVELVDEYKGCLTTEELLGELPKMTKEKMSRFMLPV